MKYTLKTILLLSVFMSATCYSAEDDVLGLGSVLVKHRGAAEEEADTVGELPSFRKGPKSRRSKRSGKSDKSVRTKTLRTYTAYLETLFLSAGMDGKEINTRHITRLADLIEGAEDARKQTEALQTAHEASDERIAELQALLEARSGLAEEEVKRRELEAYERGRAEAKEEIRLAEDAKRKAEGAKRVEGLKKAVASAESVVASQMGSPAARLSAKMKHAGARIRSLEEENRRLATRARALEARLAEFEEVTLQEERPLRELPLHARELASKTAAGVSSPAMMAAARDEAVTKRKGGSRLAKPGEAGTGSASDLME